MFIIFYKIILTVKHLLVISLYFPHSPTDKMSHSLPAPLILMTGCTHLHDHAEVSLSYPCSLPVLFVVS